MLSSYWAPWGDVRAPAAAIERHLAKCRVLDLPYETPPLVVAKALKTATGEQQASVQAEVERSVADLAGMTRYNAPGYNPADAASAFDVLEDLSGVRHVALWGGRGGKKTTDIAKSLIRLAAAEPRFIVCGREYMTSIKESSKAALEKAIKADPSAALWTVTEYQLRHQNGSRIVFIGMQNDPGSLDGIDVFWGDEAAFFSQHSLDRLIPTVRDGGSTCIWSWNPSDGPETPIDAMFRGEDVPERSAVAGVMASDNPWLYRTSLHMELRNSYRKAKRSGNYDDFNHIWRGGYKSRSDAAVFTDVSTGYVNWTAFACQGFGHHIEHLHGFDFGYGGADDSAAIAMTLIHPQALPDYDPESGQKPVLYVRHEASEPAVPNHELHKLPGRWGRDQTFLCDNANPLMIQALVDAGMSARPAVKGPGSAMAGFRKLASCEVLVSPDCPKAFQQFTNLKYETDRKTGKLKKPMKVVDKDAHLVAAARYAISEISLAKLENGGVDYV